MYKNLKNNNDKFTEGNSTVSRLFSVITGFISVILVQQVTNLVNKFAVLLHKYRFRQDSRDKPENDGCWGRLFMFFPFFKLLNRMYHPGSSANELTLKAKDDNKSVLQLGRSMIEMLGVLAIIAVLSVGGIAGYSKAMEKFKLNKLKAEYNHLIFGLLEYKDNFQKYTKNEPHLTDFVQSVGLVPDSWRMIDKYSYLEDSHGNWVDIRYRETTTYRGDDEPEHDGLIFDFYLNAVNVDDNGSQTSENFQDKVCVEMVDSIFKPLHYALKGLILIGGAGMYYGDAFCGSGRRCLKNQTLSQIKDMCDSCRKHTNRCAVTVIF